MTTVAWKPGQPLLLPQEAADYLRITKASLYDLVQQKRIEHIKLDRRNLRFTKQQLDAYVADKVQAALNRPGRRVTTPRRTAASPASLRAPGAARRSPA